MNNIRTMNKQSGFTLIELMIVIAIIAILAAIAIPAYQDYTIRSQASEGMALVSSAKLAVAQVRDETGAFPTSNASAGLAASASIIGKYVASVNVTGNGTIVSTYGRDVNDTIDGDTIIFVPTTIGGSITWDCEAGTLDAKYRPSACRP